MVYFIAVAICGTWIRLRPHSLPDFNPSNISNFAPGAPSRKSSGRLVMAPDLSRFLAAPKLCEALPRKAPEAILHLAKPLLRARGARAARAPQVFRIFMKSNAAGSDTNQHPNNVLT